MTRLVGVSWVAGRTGLHRTTVQQAAKAGRIPGTTKLLDVWRFDPDEIERWIAAGQPRQTTRTPIPSSEPEHDHQRVAAVPTPDTAAAKSPALVVLFPDAPWRGINDRPADQPATARRRRRARS
jgi:hypothetical protein